MGWISIAFAGAAGAVLSPVLAPAALGLIGFSPAGPVADSIAAAIQAVIGDVAAGSLFAAAQSATMGAAAGVAIQAIRGKKTAEIRAAGAHDPCTVSLGPFTRDEMSTEVAVNRAEAIISRHFHDGAMGRNVRENPRSPWRYILVDFSSEEEASDFILSWNLYRNRGLYKDVYAIRY